VAVVGSSAAVIYQVTVTPQKVTVVKKVLMKQRIHNTLLALIKTGPYYPCSINPKTGQMTIDVDRNIKPTGVSIKEISSSFKEALRNKRSFGAGELSQWLWNARVQFSEEVACEEFEEAATAVGIKIPPAIGAPEQRALLARLADSDYDHPPEQSPNRGTTVTFVFEIVPDTLRK